MWMARSPLGSAYDMEGAFNSAVASIDREANVEDVIDRIDDLLAPYGATGAIARADQLSHRFLSEEFRPTGHQREDLSAIFLGVAAFLLNVVVSRLISMPARTDRQSQGFRLFQFRRRAALFQAGAGDPGRRCGAGRAVRRLARAWLSSIYTQFFRLPYLVYLLPPGHRQGTGW